MSNVYSSESESMRMRRRFGGLLYEMCSWKLIVMSPFTVPFRNLAAKKTDAEWDRETEHFAGPVGTASKYKHRLFRCMNSR